MIYAISDLVFSIGLTLLRSIRDVLTHVVRRLGSDGKQRHLVYMKKASTFISPNVAAWPDPRLQHFSSHGRQFAWHGTEGSWLQTSMAKIQVSADKEWDRFWLSVSICLAQMSWCKGSGDNLQASLIIKTPNLISRKHYAAIMVWWFIWAPDPSKRHP